MQLRCCRTIMPLAVAWKTDCSIGCSSTYDMYSSVNERLIFRILNLSYEPTGTGRMDRNKLKIKLSLSVL